MEDDDPEGAAVVTVLLSPDGHVIAQRTRFKGTNQPGLAQARSILEQAWPGFVIAEITQPLAEKAGVFAEAAAHQLHEQFALPLSFACFDRRLNQTAKLLQLEVLP